MFFKIKKNFFFYIISILIFFLILEVLLRVFKIEYPIFQRHDEIRGFSLLPKANGYWKREGNAFVKINSQGLRDKEHEFTKKNNIYRIAVVGDSFAEARSVNINNTFWYQIPKNLDQCCKFNKNIEMINFGVSEYGTAQQYLTIKNNVWKYDPDLILLAFYTGNDVADNKKELSKKKYRPYFNIIDGKMTLDESFKLSKPYKILSSLPGRSFVYISQFSRIAQLFREAYVQYYFSKQTNKNKVISKPNTSNLYNPSDPVWSDAWVVTENLLLMIKDEINSKNKDFVLVTLSNPIQVNPIQNEKNIFQQKNNVSDIFYPDKRLKEFSDSNQIKVVNVAKKMSMIAKEKKVYFHGFNNTKLGTGHWNIEGHRVGSKIISDELCKLFD